MDGRDRQSILGQRAGLMGAQDVHCRRFIHRRGRKNALFRQGASTERRRKGEGRRQCHRGRGVKRLVIDAMAEGPLPNLIISDFMMPVLNGAGMLLAMRKDELYRAIPCILMSSILEEAVRRHIDGYEGFLKPF
jgi:CheY-like chemotaxis protein